ncbi:MAG: histidine kinase dimerization/phospho-acceptor domain-containing protein [Polyangiaceae bacterium]
MLLPDDAGRLTVASTTPGMPDETELADDEATQWVLEHGRPAGLGTGTFPRTAISCFPLGSAPAVLGVLAICPTAGRPPGSEERQTMLAFARQTAIALSRARLAEEAKTSALRATSEELRSSLLANVSHDLRTPIAAITGAAAALRDASPHLSDEQRTDLLGSITHEAERIERLVGNLLEMTRIEAGGHEIKRELLPLRALISAALARLAAKIGGRSVRVDLPPDLPLISVDPLLMEQVFVNLLDNAERHTPRDAEVEIRAHEGDGDITVEVLDRGPGLVPGTESKVFEKFFRGPSRGLRAWASSICKGVIERTAAPSAPKTRVTEEEPSSASASPSPAHPRLRPPRPRRGVTRPSQPELAWTRRG